MRIVPRSQRAASLLELVVASIIMVAAFAAIGEIVVMTTQSSMKLTNSVDGITSMNFFLEKFTDDVHQSVSIGYVSPNPPAVGWSTDPATSLVLQQPVYFFTTDQRYISLNGVPTPIVDTTFYQVLPDANFAGHYLIEQIRYAQPAATLRPAIPYDAANPHVVLRGLTSDQVFTPISNPPGIRITLNIETPIPAKGTPTGIKTHIISSISSVYPRNQYATSYLHQ